jgi:hypothetical protein
MSLRNCACAVLAASLAYTGNAVALPETAAETQSTASSEPTPPAPTVTDRRIVVIGQAEPPTEQEVAEQARNVSIIGDPLHNPLPRFEDHLCPGVLGMKAEAAEIIVQRIRFNAEDLGIRLADNDGTCKPNLIVAFVEGAQEQLQAMARNQGYMFAGLSVNAKGELFDSSAAARVWTNMLTRTRDGMPVPTSRDAASTPERSGLAMAGTDQQGNPVYTQTMMKLPPVAAMQAAHSRIFFPTREDIVSVLVLFERDAVRGKTLLQLADYATMRGLASTRETNGEPAADTILSLFDGDGPKPQRLTAFDQAYLTTLYEGMANLPAASKLAAIHDEMERVAVAVSE